MQVHISLFVAALLSALFGAQPAMARGECPVVDIESVVETVAAQSTTLPLEQRVAAYRSNILDRYGAVYEPSVFGMQAGPRFAILLERAIGRSLGNAGDPQRPLALREFRSSLASVEAAFKSAFPRFRCNFTIYVLDSFGTFDGAGRIVGGKPALVIGVDRLVAERSIISLPVFITHELFHRYHFDRTGISDDPGERQAIWRALWAEGLATYMSYRLTPGATVESALITPGDLAARARPQVPLLATRLLAHLDQVDADTFRYFFEGGPGDGPSAGVPWRTGYYLGFLVAEDLSRSRSLAALSELNGQALREAIAASLRRLAAARQPPDVKPAAHQQPGGMGAG